MVCDISCDISYKFLSIFYFRKSNKKKKTLQNKNSKEALSVFLKIDDTLYNVIVLKNQSTLIKFILNFFPNKYFKSDCVCEVILIMKYIHDCISIVVVK